MYKSKIILALFVSTFSTAAYAVDEPTTAPIGGLPLAGINNNSQAPTITDVNGAPLIEEDTKPKLKSVKDLFKSKKSLPEANPDNNEKTEDINVIDPANMPPQEIKSLESPIEEPVESAIPPAVPPAEPATLPAFPPVSSPATTIPESASPEAPKVIEETSDDLIGIKALDDIPASEEQIDQTGTENEKESDQGIGGRSIMFNQKNILSVMRVLSAYIESNSNTETPEAQDVSRKSLEDLQKELLAQLKPEEFVKGKKDIVTVRLPAYVKVDSILFRSPTNKQVWVNKHKFSEADNNGELTIKSIQKDWVYIELSTKDTNVDLEKFKEMAKKSESGKIISIDTVKKTISFRLAVNQFIDLEKLKIKEGDFNIATIDTENKAGHYYDPMKPEDRFVPLEEAQKAAEAKADEPPPVKEKQDPNTLIIKPVIAIDADETAETDKAVEELEIKNDKDDSSVNVKDSDIMFKLEPDPEDPNYQKFQQTAKDALANGKVSEKDKALMESIANGDNEIEIPIKKQ